MNAPYTVNSYDVCVPGFEPLRGQMEWMITVPVDRTSTVEEIRDAMRADIQSYMQPEWFDFDKANAMIDAFCVDLNVRALANIEPAEDGEEGCNLYLYIQAPEDVPVYQF
jgi:hypothetical protein